MSEATLYMLIWMILMTIIAVIGTYKLGKVEKRLEVLCKRRKKRQQQFVRIQQQQAMKEPEF